MKEIVLPSGRFATLRPITWRDRVITYSNTDLEARIMALACLVVKIDGEQLTKDQAGDMELSEAQPIIEVICQEMVAGFQSKGVA